MVDETSAPLGSQSRRDLLRRGAIVGGGLVWATPAVQAVNMSKAFAQTGSDMVVVRCDSTTIVSMTANVRSVGSPSNLGKDQTESDTQVSLMREQSDVSGTAVTVGISGPGTYQQSGGTPKVVSTIPAATRISSWILHLDVLANSGSTAVTISNATVVFPQDILGLIYTTPRLNASDAYPGLGTAANYFQDNTRGTLENGDQITWGADNRTLTLNMFRANGNALDDLRVITAGCPEVP